MRSPHPPAPCLDDFSETSDLMNDERDSLYVVAAIRQWNVAEFTRRVPQFPGRWLLVTDPASLGADLVRSLKPRYVFFPHWSWTVPEEVLTAAECVGFHLTDVPFGRGGSPLQNLIVRGHTETKLSALRMISDLDAGPVYMKRALSLEGAAHEIFERCASTVFDMIGEIVVSRPEPVPQSGEAKVFPRRRPAESRLPHSGPPQAAYNHIRMLDAEGYPAAFLDHGDFRIEFRGARLRDGGLEAHATFLLADRDS